MPTSLEKRTAFVLTARAVFLSILALGEAATLSSSGSFAAPLPQAAIPSVTVTVISAADGDTIPARCSISDQFGNDRFPPPATSFYHNVEEGYFYTEGVFSVDIPEGDAVFRAGRGFEYKPVEYTAEIVADTSIVIELERVCDPLSEGIFSGDIHLHLNHGYGYYTLDPAEAKMIARAEGLSVMNCLDNEYYFTGAPDECSDGECIIYMSEEMRSGVWGHYGLIGLERLLGPYGSNWGQLLSEIADSVHSQEGGLVVCSHPVPTEDFFQIIDWPGSGIARLLPADVASGRIDAYEVMSYSNADDGIETEVWYDLLNCGFRLPAAGGTDALLNQLGQYPAGGFRTWVYTGEPLLSFENWVKGIREGRTFVTNGPLFSRFDIFGMPPGKKLCVLKGEYLVPVEITLDSAFPVDRVEIIRNGLVVKRLFPSTDPCRIDTLVNIRVSESSWIAGRTFGANDNWFTKGDSLFAHTSPFYIEMRHMRIVEEDAAERLSQRLEDLLTIVRAREDWETAADSIRADDYVSWGRDYFAALAGSVVSAGEAVSSGAAAARITCGPNPFNASLRITIEDAGVEGVTSDRVVNISLVVYDVSGRRVRDLSQAILLSGGRTVYWDGRDGNGREVASGVYFLRLTHDGSSRAKKIVLLR